MRKTACYFVLLLATAAMAEARQFDPALAPRKFDVAINAAVMNASPGSLADPPYDRWYPEGRYAISLGRYFGDQLKIELEYAASGEGSLFRILQNRNPGSALYPVYVEEFHRLEQGSVRIIRQFGNNAWVHPYLTLGLVGDRDRLRSHTQAQYASEPGRAGAPTLVTPEMTSGPTYEYRLGLSAGGGAKFYFSRYAFVNAGGLWSQSNNSKTVHFFTGIGIDF